MKTEFPRDNKTIKEEEEEEEEERVVCLGFRRQNGDSFLLCLHPGTVRPAGVHLGVLRRVRQRPGKHGVLPQVMRNDIQSAHVPTGESSASVGSRWASWRGRSGPVVLGFVSVFVVLEVGHTEPVPWFV